MTISYNPFIMTSLAIVGAVVLFICIASVFDFLKSRSQATIIQLAGSGLFLVMVLTHVAEHFHLLMAMRWGSRDSIGHYLDLISAIGGASLFCSGFVIRLVRNKQRAR